MKINDYQQSFKSDSAVSSVVEHFLDTEGVTGSNPVSRTIFLWGIVARIGGWAAHGEPLLGAIQLVSSFHR